MQFDSLIYAFFLAAVFLIYWALQSRHYRYQNLLLLTASYIFYGWWDWRFLALIAFTTLTTFSLALLGQRNNLKKVATSFSILLNLGVLCTFKYFNFFTESLSQLTSAFGVDLDIPTVQLILPIGISFFTFQAISYSIDVYRGTIAPTKDFSAFATYIAFFPQLVAGPIEKAKNLLPQFMQKRTFNYADSVIGMRQILWGLTKKIVIANNIGNYADNMLFNPSVQSASTLILGSIFFSIQIYADFSAYSDIAIGSARLLNIKLSPNFRYPFFSRDMAETWNRWHITLMEWFRDYIYIPLGGSKKGSIRTYLNILIVFTLSGLWHGANHTYIIWGILNGIFVILSRLTRNKKLPQEQNLSQLPSMFITFLIMAFCLIPFRCLSISDYSEMMHYITHNELFCIPKGLSALKYLIPFFIIEWFARKQEFPLYKLPSNRLIRWSIYWTLLALIAYHSSNSLIQFIYFQF